MSHNQAQSVWCLTQMRPAHMTVPRAFIVYALLRGYGDPHPRCIGPEVTSCDLRSFHRAKISPKGTQPNTICCTFLPKLKLNTENLS